MARIAVFGYASLVSAESAARTLGRPVAPVPARVAGWRRRWSICRDNLNSEKTFARTDDGSIPPFILGLNIERTEPRAAGPNGVLIEVSEDELTRLDLREMRYDRVEVSADLGSVPDGLGQIVTYVAKPAHFAADPPAGAVILSSYAVAVESAFAAMRDAELSLYRETTQDPPVDLVEATLVRDEIPAGNPREW